MCRLALPVLLLASALAGQPAENRIALKDRMWFASKIYAAVLQYFGHWQAVPDLDFDASYRTYLDQIAATDDRVAFSLATMELFAKLRNGHTDFVDEWLWKNDGEQPGLYLEQSGSKWRVELSAIAGLEPGQVVTSIDGQPVEDFLTARIKYAAGSDDRARLMKVFFMGFLWPRSFTLSLEDGRTLNITRGQTARREPVRPSRQTTFPEGVVYHRIPSFGDNKYEDAAIEFLKANATAKLVIFDVRGNGGGSSPERLLRALMDRPWRDWRQASALSIGLFAAYADLYNNVIPKDADPRLRGYLEGFSEYFERPYFLTPGVLKRPENPIYKGPVFILQDRQCASACEDFVMPLKTTGRARVFGERTFGSSGQPYLFDFGKGMRFRVGAKRMYLPDGSEFEGIGIRPDVEVPSPLESKDDPVLNAALASFTPGPGQ